MTLSVGSMAIQEGCIFNDSLCKNGRIVLAQETRIFPWCRRILYFALTFHRRRKVFESREKRFMRTYGSTQSGPKDSGGSARGAAGLDRSVSSHAIGSAVLPSHVEGQSDQVGHTHRLWLHRHRLAFELVQPLIIGPLRVSWPWPRRPHAFRCHCETGSCKWMLLF